MCLCMYVCNIYIYIYIYIYATEKINVTVINAIFKCRLDVYMCNNCMT